MKKHTNRRKFLKITTVAGIGLAVTKNALYAKESVAAETKVGIIGLDTEHSVKFTQALNDPNKGADLAGFRVVAAYPKGSNDIEFSLKVMPTFTAEMKKMGIEIVDSIDALLSKVDVVLLETNDGRLHLEQALPVIKAGKPLFIDKPIAASLADALSIFEAAAQHKVPVFSASSLRYMDSAQQIVKGKIGKVMGADTYSPAVIEKTHPDLFWYGVHGVEALFTVMGTGCKSVQRYYTEGTDVVVGLWEDNRIGTFRGIRTGAQDFGGNAFGEKGIAVVGPWEGYRSLVVEIVKFFRTGQAPVSSQETLEIFAFMEAAEESKNNGGAAVSLASVMQKARKPKNRQKGVSKK
ncbi:Gfo/Idh/MocA family oxidoreductase [Adhaeribacter swui]|uniref:Gfo/Idh/MocA family oxidoreductase n=1 Tax=Adhaeribacter swui TaxID=2086471 RepID=A0A7G7GES9_9BACT|nr:Gfo/Idh/MocA family oxidoreductase [Adhaeribacter swui]QNF35663.1 Gfo/Idh/MocA family oxidoreductase [Adhaeribacter swui]